MGDGEMGPLLRPLVLVGILPLPPPLNLGLAVDALVNAGHVLPVLHLSLSKWLIEKGKQSKVHHQFQESLLF